jgi:wyosine [tRNA(Phe)-imidazoG37] synthetase (radical SAM superfamily)
MKYIYGPVESRRLGLSLGLSLTPHKICSFNCIYCQLGRTIEATQERKEYVPIKDILDELKLWLLNHAQDAKTLQFITLSGAGEPTLNIKIDTLISGIKEITATPIAVITNASLLIDASVREALGRADLIIPSLNAVTSHVFQKVNRPHPDIKIEKVIDSLIALRREFSGKIWLEVMLARGVNDDLRQVKKMKEVIERINPDKIQVNSPVRTTAEPNVFSVGKSKLGKIKEILGEKCEII